MSIFLKNRKKLYMKEKVIIFSFLIIVFIFPLQIYAREAELYDDKNSYIPYNNPKPTSIYDDSRTKTEAVYNNIFDKVLHFNSHITITPSVVNNQDPPVRPTVGQNSQTTQNPYSPVPTQTPNGLQINQSFIALDQLWEYVGNKVGVPPCILEAVSDIEYPAVKKFSPEEILQYQQPGQVIPKCPWNSCSAAGHMQMTMGIDEYGSMSCNRCCWTNNNNVTKCQTSCPNAWEDKNQGRSVLRYESGNYTPNVCNLRDSTFASAQKLKNDSKTDPDDMNWSIETMIKVGGNYYGSSTQRHIRLGNRTYGEYLAYNCSL